MVTPDRGRMGAGLLAVALLGLGYVLLRPASDPVKRAARRLETGLEIPAIDLARVGRIAPPQGAPSRDIFRFGRAGRDLDPVPTPVIALAPTPGPTVVPTPELPPTPTPWPTLNVSLIGIVDNGAGRKIGSFVKDGDILLVGEAGQVLGNAFRVVRIGTESAEIEELGSGRTRRLPLRTNQSS